MKTPNKPKNAPNMLEKVSIVLWEELGILPHDLIGWPFSKINAESVANAPDATGIIAHAPVTVHVKNGKLSFEEASNPSAFQLERNWSNFIELNGDRLIFKLPLMTLRDRSVLVVAPPDGAGDLDDSKYRVVTTCHNDNNPEITITYVLNKKNVTLDANQPLAHLIPVAVEIEEDTSPEVPHEPEQPVAPAVPTQHYEASAVPDEFIIPDFNIQVWRLHPRGARLEPADKTLRGDAPHGAVRWCGPFTHANQYGYWVFPPIDIDIIWYGGRSYDYKIHTPYTDDDWTLISGLQRPDDRYQYAPRNKIDFGGVLDSVVSIWTGCIFQTPPGWGLMVRNPINVSSSTVFRIQEGILETDWMPYDVWMNLQFLQQDKWVHIRRDQPWPPIAQLIPVRREGYDKKWNLIERPFERSTAEGQNMFDRWNHYNYKKWVEKAHKEPSTYHRERAAALKRRPDLPEDSREGGSPGDPPQYS